MGNQTLILLAATLVTLPVLTGIVLRQIHISSFQRMALPWLSTTLVFAIAIIKIEQLQDMAHLVLSMAISVAWITTGLFLRFFQPKEIQMQPDTIRSAFSTIGWIFIGFGFVWGAITLVQHLR